MCGSEEPFPLAGRTSPPSPALAAAGACQLPSPWRRLGKTRACAYPLAPGQLVARSKAALGCAEGTRPGPQLAVSPGARVSAGKSCGHGVPGDRGKHIPE